VYRGEQQVVGPSPCLYPHSALYRGGEFKVLALEMLAW